MDARLTAYLDELRRSEKTAERPSNIASDPPPFRTQVREAGLVWRSAVLVAAHALEMVVLIASWVAIGQAALNGHLEAGWLAAWALCLASTVPLRVATRWLEGVVALGFGGLLKQRLLSGAMAMDADRLRSKGSGQTLSEVLESDAIERLAMANGLDTALAAIELILTPVMFVWSSAPVLEILVLALWIALAIWLAMRKTRRESAWATARIDLTHHLVEKMTGHRTRLTQQPPSEWHLEEDRELDEYSVRSRQLDGLAAVLESALSRGYLIAALFAMAPAFLSGHATLAAQAATFGTLLFAAGALDRLAYGFAGISAAAIAWRCVKPVFDCGDLHACEGVKPQSTAAGKALQVRDVVYTYPGRAEPVLNRCSLTVDRGELVLIDGESGSGKSTFASVIAGLRRPTAGTILAGGVDPQTAGDPGWRRRVAAAPQYHENHILSAPLGFNLLLARPDPHDEGAWKEALELCEELGLGPLLERMPAGLDQMVGETGWQLSHGERSRVFLARALLQPADVVVLDESFAALDPESLRQCLECAMRRAKTLLVVAHP